MSEVIVATPDVVGERMAGPGIRAFHFADELAKRFDVALVARGEPGGLDPRFRAEPLRSLAGRRLIREAKVLIGQPFRGLRAGRQQKLVCDLFTPILLELEQIPRRAPRMMVKKIAESWRLRAALRRADVLIVASARQRELYEAFASEQRLAIRGKWIEVGFGIDPAPPPAPSFREVPTIVWNGGIWPWLDPGTAVAAVRRLSSEGVECRLVFAGTRRPYGLLGENQSETSDGVVEWRGDWTPYRERGSLLAGSRLMIMLHHDTREALYSYRIRFFDALWAGVPVVATRGGAAAGLIEQEGLGIVVEPGDVEGVTAAIRRLIEDDGFHSACVSSLERVRVRFGWDRVVAPLRDAVEALLE
ncbi:MAG: glycosyltransferase family 4 protein [Acidobacteria bacterium]|nr:glycosyltransferase family 4 protein [Acidobacteriota bacterium]